MTIQQIKVTILTIGLFATSSCSVFHYKYVETQGTDGKCWTEYHADILSDELLDSNNIKNEVELIIKLQKKNENASNFRNLFYGYFIVKLLNTSINYEVKYGIDNSAYLTIPEGEYAVSIYYNDPHTNYVELDTQLENIILNKGEKRLLKIDIAESTPCETYITTEKFLRSELRKNRKLN